MNKIRDFISKRNYLIVKFIICFSLILITTIEMFNEGIESYFCYETYIEGEFSYLMVKLIKVFITIMEILVFSFVIFNIDKLYKILYKSNVKKNCIYAIYITVSFLMLFNPMSKMKTGVLSFKRSIGIGVISNFDCTRVINNFILCGVVFAVVFFCSLIFVGYIAEKEYKQDELKIILFLKKVIHVANINMIYQIMNFFFNESNETEVFYYSVYLIDIIIILSYLYIVLSLERKISATNYGKLIISSLCMGYFVSVASSGNWGNGRHLLGIQFVIVFLMLIYIWKVSKPFKNFDIDILTNTLVVVLSIFPLMTSVYIEFVNILNQHRIFVSNPRKWYIICGLIVSVLCVFLYYFLKKKSIKIINWKKWIYPILLIGIGMLSVQLPLQMVKGANMFESANYSILISDFLYFGKIPIFEHYGGHMMTDVWEGILYAILNFDIEGAIFSPYAEYITPILVVLFYFFVKNIYDEDMAFAITLIIPFYGFWNYYGLGMLVCIAMILFINKNTYIRALIIWLSFVWCALYRLDLGYSFGISCILTLVIWILVEKRWNAIRPLLNAFFTVLLSGVTLWFAICIIKKIEPIDRLIEFIHLSMSNLSWGRASLGDNSTMKYVWYYIVIPLSTEITLLYTIFSKKFRNNIGNVKWVILLLFGFAYFVNFPRGIVRHNLEESNMMVVVWSSCLFLATFVCLYFRKKYLLAYVYTLFLILNVVMLQGGILSDNALIDNSVREVDSIVDTWTDEVGDEGLTYWQELSRNKTVVQRVLYAKWLDMEIKPVRDIVDLLLDKNETFVDYYNQSFLYSALGKENPVYVAQSPIMLSDEFTQKQFIRQIRDNIDNIPIAVMPTKGNYLDSIAINYKYYLVSEYIYNNYEPLCATENFAIWCLPEKTEQYKGIIENYGKLSIEEVFEGIEYKDCIINIDEHEESVIIKGSGMDPMVVNFHKNLKLKEFVGKNITIKFKCESEKEGMFQLFYTSERDEEFNRDRNLVADINKQGEIEFNIPITEFTKIRLDIPQDFEVKITSISVYEEKQIRTVSWGYDLPENSENSVEEQEYIDYLHNYFLKQLPVIWAEKDENEAINNEVLTDVNRKEEIFIIENSKKIDKSTGNYLLFNVDWIGSNNNAQNLADDEIIECKIKLGSYENEIFDEKFQYTINLMEGNHSYLLRVSSDYFWYSDDINAIRFELPEGICPREIKILKGD